MNLARSSVKLSIAHGGTAFITFGGVAVFANWLAPAELGIYFLFEALVGILTIPADFGIRGAAEKRISEGKDPEEMLTSALLLKAVPLSIVATAVLLFGGFINDYVGANVTVLLVVALLGHELYQFGVQLVAAELRVGETAVLKLSHKLVWFAVGYGLLQYGFGVTGLIYGLLAGYAVPSVWAMFKRTTPFGRPSMAHVNSLTAYSRYNFLSALSGYFYGWMDVLIIGLFLTSAAVGSYEVAWRVTAVVIIGSNAIAHTIFPQVSRWDKDRAIARIEQLIPRAVTPSLVIAVPAFFGALLFSREILTYVFDEGYATAWLVLIVLMGEKIFQSIHVVTGRSLKAIDHPELAAKAAVLAMVTNLVLNFVLIWQFGLIGAAVATVVSFGLNTVLCIRYLSRFLTVRLPWDELGWILVSSVGMAGALWAVQSVFVVDSLLRLIGVIALGAVLYGGLLLLSADLREQVRDVVRQLGPDGSAGDLTQGGD